MFGRVDALRVELAHRFGMGAVYPNPNVVQMTGTTSQIAVHEAVCAE